MLSVIIPTRDSERALVHTLAALVPGATAGVVREVIVADGGSRDETEQVADIAGCVFLSSGQSLGARLKAAAETGTRRLADVLGAGRRARARPGSRTRPLSCKNGGQARRVFAARPTGLAGRLRRLFAALPGNEQGLDHPQGVLRRARRASGGRRDPERDLLRRIGRSRLTVLRAPISRSRYLTQSNNCLTLSPARSTRQVTHEHIAQIRRAHRRGAALLALLHAPARPAAGEPGAHALLAHRGARALRAGASRAR